MVISIRHLYLKEAQNSRDFKTFFPTTEITNVWNNINFFHIDSHTPFAVFKAQIAIKETCALSPEQNTLL